MVCGRTPEGASERSADGLASYSSSFASHPELTVSAAGDRASDRLLGG